jgi:hypothetical protein
VFTLDAAAKLQEQETVLISWKQSASEITIQGLQNQFIANYQVFSNTGQKVIDVQLNAPTSSILLEQLQSGMYLIQVELNNGQRQAFRIVKP